MRVFQSMGVTPQIILFNRISYRIFHGNQASSYLELLGSSIYGTPPFYITTYKHHKWLKSALRNVPRPSRPILSGTAEDSSALLPLMAMIRQGARTWTSTWGMVPDGSFPWDFHTKLPWDLTKWSIQMDLLLLLLLLKLFRIFPRIFRFSRTKLQRKSEQKTELTPADGPFFILVLNQTIWG